MVGGVWNGFLLGHVRGQAVTYRFCGAPDNDGHLFWECPFPPLVEIRENPEFHGVIGLGACSGMVGFLCFLVSLVLPPGPLVQMRVLATFLKFHWGVILLVWLLSGVLLMSLMKLMLPL